MTLSHRSPLARPRARLSPLARPRARFSPLARPRARFDDDRAKLAAEARAGFPGRGGSPRLCSARARLACALWNARGERKLAGAGELDAALAALPAAELEWICELSPLGPLYLLPTRRFIGALVRSLAALQVEQVLEVAAGDGLLARSLQRAAPHLTVRATDSGAWQDPQARMSDAERRLHAAQAVPGLALGAGVQKLGARRAIARYKPELVLCSWLPPGHRLLDALIRSPVRYVLELGAGSGITASAYCWRFAHEFLEGPLESSARCRLDARPAALLHSRATLYFGAAHPEHYEERVRPGDWLYQFKPAR